jgi:hypothetical protein
MTKSTRSLIPGIVLIVIGAVFLLYELDLVYFRWRQIYPLVFLGLGVLFLGSVFTKGDKGASFPATIFLVLGAFFYLRNFGYFSIDYYFYDFRDFWPIFLLAFGLGFVVLFLFRRDDWGLLVPGGVLLFFGAIFFLRTLDILYWRNVADFWPIILIAVGLSMIINTLRKKPEQRAQE